MINPTLLIASLSLLFFVSFSAIAQTNYDESKVPEYTLPDPLTLNNGEKVTDAKTWEQKRRAEVLQMFHDHMYGAMPAGQPQLYYDLHESTSDALGGKAIRKQLTLYFSTDKSGPQVDVLMYIPKSAEDKPVPAFLTINFQGNHTVHSDPAIRVPQSWVRNRDGIKDNKPRESDRGKAASRWSIERMIDSGYAFVTVYYGDIDPDYHDGFKNGIHALFPKYQNRPDNFTSIGAWAYGLSYVMDYLQTDKLFNNKQVAVMGHSRLGKTSLWAGASDQRFALVISNNSGCGGAALSRRAYGETVKRINTSFPHWFTESYKKFNDNEGKAPFDQHMLIALMAPRAVYIASAEGDRWADPKGEFLSGLHASPVYRLFNKPGFSEDQSMPGVNTPIHTTIGYHMRTGKHDVTDYDWEQYIKFADKHFK